MKASHFFSFVLGVCFVFIALGIGAAITGRAPTGDPQHYLIGAFWIFLLGASVSLSIHELQRPAPSEDERISVSRFGEDDDLIAWSELPPKKPKTPKIEITRDDRG